MRDTFKELERGREALAELADRDFAAFSEARVLEQLTNGVTIEDLQERRCP